MVGSTGQGKYTEAVHPGVNRLSTRIIYDISDGADPGKHPP